ncbi:hypothetical protein VPJ68_09535, partial [Parabacteroides distasonis]
FELMMAQLTEHLTLNTDYHHGIASAHVCMIRLHTVNQQLHVVVIVYAESHVYLVAAEKALQLIVVVCGGC